MEAKCEYSELSIPNDPAFIAVASAYVRSVARKLGFSETDQEKIGAAVKSRLKELCLKHFDVITPYVDLADPATYWITSQFEEMGFFFSTILLGGSGSDALILQYLNNVPLDYGRIKIHSRIGRDVLKYIQKHDPNRL